jgi:FAD dependent oxidoreductase
LNRNDSIGLLSYNIDTHNAQRFPQGEYVRNEGDIEVFGNLGPAQMPYSIIIPRASEATNVFAPVPCSASHMGFGAIRLEPQWMILGESAGVAAAQAISNSVTVQNVNVTALQDRLIARGQYINWPITTE